MIHIKEILIKKYGKVPNSLDGVLSDFEDGKMLFFNGLENALRNRKKTPFERYVDVARIVFGFFDQMYSYQKKMKMKDKVGTLLGKGFNDKFWRDFLKEFLEYQDFPKKSCGCEAEKDRFFREYEKIFSVLPEIGGLESISHHFMRKIQEKRHPFMTGYIVNFLGKEEKLGIERFIFPFLLIESVIHGIDDYVDVADREKEEYTNDVLNIVLGLFALTFYLLEKLKVGINEISKLMVGKKTRIEELVDSLFFSLTKLSEVPIIEKNTMKIIEYRKDREMEMAIKNMKTRAAGINIFLVLSSYFLYKTNETDYKKLCELIKYYRIMELLEKDIDDIPKDLKNKDYTPVAVWWKKYKGNDIYSEKVESLARIFFGDATSMHKKIKNYTPSKTIFMENLQKKFNKVISKSKRG